MKSDNKKIPKVIHYCWFGGKPKPSLVLKCIESWKRVLPGYEIKEWNESNFDINFNTYTKSAYDNKKWAFVSDVARLKALLDEGGIYLDTDIYVVKSFDDLLDYEVFLGKEDEEIMNGAVLGARKRNVFIEDLLTTYNSKGVEMEVIPKIITDVYKKNQLKYSGVKIFDKIYFYPFNSYEIKQFNYKNAPEESYAVHLWNYSWGHPLNKLIKRIGLHRFIKKSTEKLGIKEKIKKIFNIT